jgi:5'-nucleotidase
MLSRAHRLAIATVATSLVAAPLAATVPASANPSGTGLVINEVYPNGGGASGVYRHDYVELHNPTGDPIGLAGKTLQYRSQSGAAFSSKLELVGAIPAGGYFLVQLGNEGSGGSSLPQVDQEASGLSMSATSGTLALAPSTATVPSAPADLAGSSAVIDVVGWGSPSSYEGAASVAGTGAQSLARTGAADSDNNLADFSRAEPTPRAAGGTPEPPAEPTRATIEQIQGSGATSPYDDRPVITRGVVTAAYPTGGINGFFLQMAGSGATLDDSSDGIFVFTASAPTVQIGDHVEVSGDAVEFFGQTQIDASAGSVEVLTEPAAAVKPADVAFPRTDAEREALEGMLVAPAGAYTLTDNYNAGNRAFGELGLATGDKPLVQPTDVARPGSPEAAEVADDNEARRVLLDDGATINFLGSDANKDLPIPYFSGPYDQVRVGAAVTFVEPVVLSYGFNQWRFQPVRQVTSAADEPVRFEQTRTSAPEEVGGTTKLASFNVLNYFTDLGEDEPGCDSFDDRDGNPIVTDFCTVRGAYTLESFLRQQAKIVTAINALDADVVSLEEVENSAAFGHDRDESLAALVDALNADAGSRVWDFVRSPEDVPANEDVIRVAFIYKRDTIRPVGESRILDDPAFVNARQPLAQAFRERRGSHKGRFVAIANHFKSKGSGGSATGDNRDIGDGQGAWNGDRIRQAQALVAFADEFSTQARTDIVFLLGDFNSYTEEDPLQVLEEAGYVNVAKGRTDEASYLFGGMVGSLDHVFASREANATVTGADVWSINSVEPVMYEYGRYNYNVTNLYAPTPYRSSDHDPIIVGFDPGCASAPRSRACRP